MLVLHSPRPQRQWNWPSPFPRATESPLTPSHDIIRWPGDCRGSATPTLSAWTRPGCPLQCGLFPCLSNTLSGQWHPPRAHLWSGALREVKRAHWLLIPNRWDTSLALCPDRCSESWEEGPPVVMMSSCCEPSRLARLIRCSVLSDQYTFPAEETLGSARPSLPQHTHTHTTEFGPRHTLLIHTLRDTSLS